MNNPKITRTGEFLTLQEIMILHIQGGVGQELQFEGTDAKGKTFSIYTSCNELHYLEHNNDNASPRVIYLKPSAKYAMFRNVMFEKLYVIWK